MIFRRKRSRDLGTHQLRGISCAPGAQREREIGSTVQDRGGGGLGSIPGTGSVRGREEKLGLNSLWAKRQSLPRGNGVMRVSSAEEGAGEEGSTGKDAKMPASITPLTAAP